ncbi:thioredoxin domain-containing protein [Desulfobacterales bacterium HSG17]|nr:thioredoxin domain-containing protein [Desulfobacterales bacterium HSG17]
MSETRPFLYRCTSCGTKNKIPGDKLSAAPNCGRCQTTLDTGELFLAQPINVNARDFDEKIIKSPIPVLLDCWAEWCSACHSFSPVVQELGRIMAQRVRVAKINVDQNPEISGKYNIMSLPTCLVFDGGEVRERFVGAIDKNEALLKMAKYT